MLMFKFGVARVWRARSDVYAGRPVSPGMSWWRSRRAPT